MRNFNRTLKTTQGRNKHENNLSREPLQLVLGGGERRELARSSEQERRVDAMALIADEGRDKLR